jgi:hypothetical protein
VLDDARTQQLPRVDDRRAVFTLQLNRHRPQSALVAISNLVERLVQIQRADNAALHRHVRCLVEPRDLDNVVLLRVAVAVKVLAGSRVGGAPLEEPPQLSRAG